MEETEKVMEAPEQEIQPHDAKPEKDVTLEMPAQEQTEEIPADHQENTPEASPSETEPTPEPLPLETEPISEILLKERKKGLWWKILLGVLAGVVLLCAVAGIVLWRVNDFYVHVSMLGEPEITVEYATVYEDGGAEGYFAGTRIFTTPVPMDVETTGSVDTAVVGDYEISYALNYEIDLLLIRFSYQDVQKRVVHVVDTQAPEITLISNEEHYTVPGQPYEEEGFSAVDGYDGDITASVQCREEGGRVYYTVTDTSGNTATAEREIRYYDPFPPELILNGNSDISIPLGSTYTEPGYTATDNYEGDITARVTVSGNVDTAASGKYTLTYSVTDSYNNVTTVTRTVRVYGLEPAPDLVMPDLPLGDGAATVVPNGKVVYLTFDDGPSAHTSRLLDVLDQYGVKATFFVVNTGYLYLLPRMVASGHTVAIHCYSHKYDRVYASDEAYFNDLYQMQTIIQSYTGIAPTLVRFPGGSSNTVSRKHCAGIITRVSQKLDELGYKYFDWNVDSRDASTARSKSEVVNNVIGGIKRRDYSIVLQHDIKGYSVDAVESIIQWGLANGYTFRALDSSSPGCHQHIAN